MVDFANKISLSLSLCRQKASNDGKLIKTHTTGDNSVGVLPRHTPTNDWQWLTKLCNKKGCMFYRWVDEIIKEVLWICSCVCSCVCSRFVLLLSFIITIWLTDVSPSTRHQSRRWYFELCKAFDTNQRSLSLSLSGRLSILYHQTDL